jgi:hypothetical protein
VIFLYALISLASDFLLSSALRSYGSVIISSFAICEYIVFSTLFYFCISNKNFKKFILFISFIDLAIELVLVFTHVVNFDFWVALITATLILVYSIFFFYEQLNSSEIIIIYKSYKFWIVIGCIIYLSGTLFLFLYTSDLKDKQTNGLWAINIVFEIVKNACFSIALVIAAKNKQNVLVAQYNDTNM